VFGVYQTVRTRRVRWEDQITPKFKEVRDALREEVEASRGLISWFRYQIVKRMKR
jgi:hypothetical protein